MCRRDTDHPAGPRIKRQEQSDMGPAPAAPGPPGKLYRTCYTTSYVQIVYRTRHRIIAMLLTTSDTTSYNSDIDVRCDLTSYTTSYENVRCRIGCRTSKWQEQSSDVRCRTFKPHSMLHCTFYVRCRIRCDIRCRTSKWQEQYFFIRCRTFQSHCNNILRRPTMSYTT